MGQLVLLMANMAVMIALLMPLEVKGASLEDRAVEEMKLVNVADREMTQFWDTFNTNWDAYKDDKVKNPNRVCTDHVKLLEELEEIKIQNGLVISAIEALKAQLTQIRVILENAEWGDHSGLHCKATPDEPICVALAALDKEADQAETKANGEKDLVLAEITRVKTYDCNCVWEQWAGKWSACSKTCEEGTKKQTREILWQKRNKGQDCNPADGVESAPCNDGCCPVNCVWDDWKPWGDCPNVCSAETQYMLRTREKKVSMECAERGGKECEGSPNERKECKILEVWDGKIAALVTKHNNLKSQIALYKEKLCDPNPCANGGSCNEGVCTCAAEFEGHHCKTPKEKKECRKTKMSEDQIKQIFLGFDLDQDKTLGEEELALLLAGKNPLEAANSKQIFKNADDDGDEHLNYEEFKCHVVNLFVGGKSEEKKKSTSGGLMGSLLGSVGGGGLFG